MIPIYSYVYLYMYIYIHTKSDLYHVYSKFVAQLRQKDHRTLQAYYDKSWCCRPSNVLGHPRGRHLDQFLGEISLIHDMCIYIYVCETLLRYLALNLL